LVLRAIDDRPYRYAKDILITQSSYLSNDFLRLPAAFGGPVDWKNRQLLLVLRAVNG